MAHGTYELDPVIPAQELPPEPSYPGQPKRLQIADVDEAGHILEDLLCRQCSYNLLTLHCDAACPECGLQVADSLFCEPGFRGETKWVRRVYLGVQWTIFGLALSLVGLAICCGLAASSGSGAVVLLTVLSLTVGCFFISGFIISTPAVEPYDAWEWCFSRLIRAMILFALGVSGLTALGWIGGRMSASFIIFCVAVVVMDLVLVGSVLLTYLRLLLRRVEDIRIPRWTDMVVAAAWCWSLGLVVPTILFSLSALRPVPPSIGGGVLILVVVLGAIVLIGAVGFVLCVNAILQKALAQRPDGWRST